MARSVQVMAVVVMALLVSCSLVSARVLLGEQQASSFQDQKFKHHPHGTFAWPPKALPTLPTLPIGLPSCSPPPASPGYEEPAPAYESPPYTPSPSYESTPPSY